MFKSKVTKLIDEALIERLDLFLIELTIDGENHIKVIIDGDSGVLVEDCMYISRFLDDNLDREEQDFSMEVMSAGAASPLTHNRQYKKNLNRTLKVKTNDGETEGVLVDAGDETITLEWKVREPKPVGKGKVTVSKEAHISYKDIIEAKVMIKF